MPVFVAYLDASKAFDKVNHRKLIEKLISLKLPPFFTNLLIHWFDHQTFCVKWGATQSESFNVHRGVRQGGIMSAILFAVYMDPLSNELNAAGVGARIGQYISNHIMYADDIALITTTRSSLSILLQICSNYAESHFLEFNSLKTDFQCFLPSSISSYLPQVYITFNGCIIHHSSQVKYLGYTISSRLRYRKMILDDQHEIRKRICELYRNANMIRSRFGHCNSTVKRLLFLAYFSCIYCCSLWETVITKSHPLRVAHNDAMRIIFGIPRYSSATEAFVNNRIGNIDFVLRNMIYSFKLRLISCENRLVTTIDNNGLNNIWNSYLFVD